MDAEMIAELRARYDALGIQDGRDWYAHGDTFDLCLSSPVEVVGRFACGEFAAYKALPVIAGIIGVEAAAQAITAALGPPPTWWQRIIRLKPPAAQRCDFDCAFKPTEMRVDVDSWRPE